MWKDGWWRGRQLGKVNHDILGNEQYVWDEKEVEETQLTSGWKRRTMMKESIFSTIKRDVYMAYLYSFGKEWKVIVKVL